MAQIGDAKGEYRGIIHRDDRELQAWLARRPAAEVLLPARRRPAFDSGVGKYSRL
jgi:hypothetical protein